MMTCETWLKFGQKLPSTYLHFLVTFVAINKFTFLSMSFACLQLYTLDSTRYVRRHMHEHIIHNWRMPDAYRSIKKLISVHECLP